MKEKELLGIKNALKEGCRIHAFRSGGGLRVVRIEKDGKLLGYGEHPHIEDALLYANEDFLAGGRPYNEVYGKSQPHFLTGSSSPTSDLDLWILSGGTFDAWQKDTKISFQFEKLCITRIPKEIIEEVIKTGNSTTWEHRGFVREITRTTFPNGAFCAESRVIKNKNTDNLQRQSEFYDIAKTGEGINFFEAMNSAFKAEEVILN